MKEKHRKSLGFGIHTHTCTRGVLFSVRRCWYALHDQIVCKSVQKVTVRVRVREDPDASGVTRTGQAELTNSQRQMLRDKKGWWWCRVGWWWCRVGGGQSSDSNTFPCVMLGVSMPQSAHMRPRQLSSVGPPQSALAPTPPALSPRLPHYQIYASCCAVSDVICAELQMLEDRRGHVLKTLLCCDEALFAERVTIRELV